MATLQISPQVAPTARTSDGGYAVAQGLRDGSISVVDFKQRMAIAGRVFTANMGSVTTPLTFLASAANRPDAWIRVPAGVAILPVFVGVVLETSLGTATEIDIRVAQNDIGNGTSTAATVGPTSQRTDSAAGASICFARQLATVDVTAETNPLSIFRRTYGPVSDGTTPGGQWRGIEYLVEPMPLLIGAASLEVYIAATTTQATGFVIVSWIETPSNWWT